MPLLFCSFPGKGVLFAVERVLVIVSVTVTRMVVVPGMLSVVAKVEESVTEGRGSDMLVPSSH